MVFNVFLSKCCHREQHAVPRIRLKKYSRRSSEFVALTPKKENRKRANALPFSSRFVNGILRYRENKASMGGSKIEMGDTYCFAFDEETALKVWLRFKRLSSNQATTFLKKHDRNLHLLKRAFPNTRREKTPFHPLLLLQPQRIKEVSHDFGVSRSRSYLSFTHLTMVSNCLYSPRFSKTSNVWCSLLNAYIFQCIKTLCRMGCQSYNSWFCNNVWQRTLR